MGTSKKCLLIVDMQYGFINEYTNHLVERVEDLITDVSFDTIISSKFINTKDGPCVTIANWNDMFDGPETDLIPVVALNSDKVVVKDTYTMITSEVLLYLENNGFQEVYVIGVNTDCCVLKTALDLFDYNIRPIVLEHYCGTTLGRRIHDNTIEILEALIGENNVIKYPILNNEMLDKII